MEQASLHTLRSPADDTPTTTEPAADWAKLESQHAGGANWFYWIAALSLVNSAILHAGGEWSFVVGLGITQVVDAIAAVVAHEAGASAAALAKGVAITADIAVAGIFVLFGLFARKRKTWAFAVGMALYAIDGLLFLMVGDWLSIGFHAFALVGLASGLAASRRLVALSAPPEEPAPAYEPIAP
jgi:hypothetical protein